MEGHEDKVIQQLRDRIRDRIHLTQSTTDESLREYIEEAVFEQSKANYLTAAEKKTLVNRLFYSFRGLDVLQPLIDDPTISEIMVNGYDQIFIEREGKVHRLSVKFDDQAKLEDIIQMIVAKVNRVVNESMPIVDARLKDGSRVNIVLPPASLKGPTMTIRKFPQNPLRMENLVERGALSEEVAKLLGKWVAAKYNIFISGGTGSGKTTFLNALSDFVPQDERIITIEDSAELQIRNIPNLVSLETRNANTEGRGEISIRQLIRTSLRMRPDRIIVGEVRGAEALDMLQAMNTGHEGSLSTAHANSILDMLSRLETMVLSGANLPIQVIRQQIASAIDIMIHLSRMRDRTRKVVEISEVLGIEDNGIALNSLYRFVEQGEDTQGNIIGSLQSTGNTVNNVMKLEFAGL